MPLMIEVSYLAVLAKIMPYLANFGHFSVLYSTFLAKLQCNVKYLLILRFLIPHMIKFVSSAILANFCHFTGLLGPCPVGDLVHEITMITAPQNLVVQLITMITAPQNLVVQLLAMITAPQDLGVQLS